MSADVVVPVYRDAAMTRACLESVLANSGPALGRLLVVNDRSPDPDMGALLERLRLEDPRVRVVENEENLGFVASCNRGLALRQGHAVVLNSDTVVPPGWLAALLTTLETSLRVAAVCPLSNNAAFCSVPDYGKGVPPQALADLHLDLSRVPDNRLATGIGFCLLMRAEVLDLLGGFDPAYGRGYNEENDWCQRAQARGYEIWRCGKTLVTHLGQVSFGAERAELDAFNARRLVARFPNFLEQNRAFERGAGARAAARAVKAQAGTLSVCVDLSGLGAPGPDLQSLAVRWALWAIASELGPWPVVRGDAGWAQGGLSAVPETTPLTGYDVVHRFDPPRTATHLAELLECGAALLFTPVHLAPLFTSAAFQRWEDTEAFRSATWAMTEAAGVVACLGEAEQRAFAAWSGRTTTRLQLVAPKHAVGKGGWVHAGGDAPWENLDLVLDALRLGPPGRELALAGPESGWPLAASSRPESWPEGCGRVPGTTVEAFEALVLGAQAIVDASTLPRAAALESLPVQDVRPGTAAHAAERLSWPPVVDGPLPGGRWGQAVQAALEVPPQKSVRARLAELLRLPRG